MLQQHGLGARPYDCSYCSLKFFFRIELDHHAVTVHRRKEGSSPSVDVGQKSPSEDWTGASHAREEHSENIIVKEEIVNSPEDEDVNVDDNVDQTDENEIKHQEHNLVNAKEEPFPVIPHGVEKIEC